MILPLLYLLLLQEIAAVPTEEILQETISLLTPFQLIILHMLGDSPEIRKLLPQLAHAGRYVQVDIIMRLLYRYHLTF